MTVPSLLILGTDAVLAASATPVQLAHACLAAGYQAVIPASWGDELIAARALDRMRQAEVPVVQCSCPLVAQRLADEGIKPMLLSFVAPPVATAAYLRAVYAPTRVHITFAGDCPGAAHESIDVWLSSDALRRSLDDRGIDPDAQPREFDSVLPPDRRRFFSDPGGVPTRAALRHLPMPVEFHELGPDDLIIDLAQQLLSSSRALLDVAPALGCRCSGAVGTLQPELARARVREKEPPRAPSPVVDHTVLIPLESALPPSPSVAPSAALPSPFPIEPTSPPAPSLAPSATQPQAPSIQAPTPSLPLSSQPETGSESGAVALAAAPRRSPAGLTRPVFGTMPHARTEPGRQLPRAYVARRRSSPRGFRESRVRRGLPASGSGKWSRQLKWVVVAAGGVGAGLLMAWLLGVTP